QANVRIEVAADRGSVVAADGDDGIAAEQPECTRNQHDGILRRAGEPEQEERAYVFDDLEARETAAWEGGFGDAPVLDAPAVRDAHIAPDRHRRRVFKERQHGATE